MTTLFRLELLKPKKKDNVYQGVFVADRLAWLRARIQKACPVQDESLHSWAKDWIGYAMDYCPNPDTDTGIASAWEMAVKRGKEQQFFFAYPSKDALIEGCGLLENPAFFTQFESAFDYGLRVVEMDVSYCAKSQWQAIYMPKDVSRVAYHESVAFL